MLCRRCHDVPRFLFDGRFALDFFRAFGAGSPAEAFSSSPPSSLAMSARSRLLTAERLPSHDSPNLIPFYSFLLFQHIRNLSDGHDVFGHHFRSRFGRREDQFIRLLLVQSHAFDPLFGPSQIPGRAEHRSILVNRMLGRNARHYTDNFLPEIVFRDFMSIGEFCYAATKSRFAVNTWTRRFEDASANSDVVAFICKGAARFVHGQRQIRFSPNLLTKT
jgi:hypothetical protein